MCKLPLVLFAVCMIGIGIQTVSIEAQGDIESEYRVPVIGDFNITRIECARHSYQRHDGIRFMDISMAGESDNGAPVYSSGAGEVTNIGEDEWGYGQYVVVQNAEVAFRYAHLARVYVYQEQMVQKGDLIGYIGNTGMSDGSHLHWEAWPISGSGFNLMKIPGILGLTQQEIGQKDTDSECHMAGTVHGEPRWSYYSCAQYFDSHSHSAIPTIVLFDHAQCKGNAVALPYGQGDEILMYDVSGNFNDRTRSIYIPAGKSIKVYAHVDRDDVSHCHAVDMWNVDEDYYDPPYDDIPIGWDLATHGWNMISRIELFNNPSCQYPVVPMVGSYDETYSNPDLGARFSPGLDSYLVDWPDYEYFYLYGAGLVQIEYEVETGNVFLLWRYLDTMTEFKMGAQFSSEAGVGHYDTATLFFDPTKPSSSPSATELCVVRADESGNVISGSCTRISVGRGGCTTRSLGTASCPSTYPRALFDVYPWDPGYDYEPLG